MGKLLYKLGEGKVLLTITPNPKAIKQKLDKLDHIKVKTSAWQKDTIKSKDKQKTGRIIFVICTKD